MTLANKNLVKESAKEVLESRDKVKENRKDLETLSDLLQTALNECEPTEAQKGVTLEDAMRKVESEAYDYIDRIDVALRNYNMIIAEAASASVLDTSAPVQRPTSAPAPQQQQGDLFREASVLKPKFLEKESNLLEVLHWIKQARNYITAGYRDTPPNEGTYKYLIPFLHSNWSNALEKYDPDRKPITEILNALEIEAKKGDPKHNRRLKMLQIRRVIPISSPN